MNPAYRRAALAVTVALGLLSVVPGVAFAANPACGDTIMSNTTLTADMHCEASGTNGVIFGTKGITLNLNGHTIWGPTGSDPYEGVDTNEKKHVTVKNGTISDWNEGLYLDESVGGTFKNLTIHCDVDDSTPDGVYMSYGTTNVLNNLTIDDGCYIGIDMYGAAHNWVTNNHITEAFYGVYTDYESLDTFINNYAEYDYAGFYEDNGGGQTWKNNKANGSVITGGYGFYFSCSDYGIVTATGNETWGNDSYGFYFYYCYDYYNSSTPGSVISGNSSHDNIDGADGFFDDYSIRATWQNNVAKRNSNRGFYLEEPGFAVFKWNIANHNGGDGIYVDENYGTSYSFAQFANNKANYNDAYGIEGDYAIANATGNTAHHNGNEPDDCYNLDCN